MHVVSFTDHICLENGGLKFGGVSSFEAGKAYLFADKQLEKVREMELNIPFERISKAEPMFKPLRHASTGERGRVLVYNGVGGMGDQIMTWPLCKILSDRGYEVHVLSEPHLVLFWYGFPWVKSIVTLPCYWSVLEMFDYVINLEYVSNGFAHSGQMQPIDLMLQTCGIDPTSVSDEEKRVAPRFTKIEKEIAAHLYGDRKLAFYQLGCSQQVRSLSPEHSRSILQALAEEFSEFHWIAIYGPLEVSHYWKEPLNAPNIEFRSFERPRLLWSIVERAELCVAPDSMLVHIAGAIGRPCVGMWGPYAPETRIKYYPNHYPIYHKEVCPLSPCHWNSSAMPHICPPSLQPRERCEVMLQITAEEVIEGARQLMASQAARVLL